MTRGIPDELGAEDIRDAFRQQSRSSGIRRASGGVASHSNSENPVDEDAEDTTRSASDYISQKAQLQERVIDEMQRRNLLGSSDEALTAAVEEFVADVLEQEDLPVTEAERGRIAQELIEETLGVGPLAPLMSDPAITDILVNGHDQVFIERFGRLEETNVQFRDDEHVRRIIERLAMRVGRRIDQSSPMVDLRLSDGSRVNATIPPATIDGPTLSIRRFGRNRLRGVDLLRLETLSAQMAEFLWFAVRNRKNILISGGTGAGKSTLLSAIAESIPSSERIVTIEDTAELILDQRHVVRMEARPMNAEGRGQISTRDLLINSLRMRPSRIIVGEVRSAEALDMLQAMNTGHEGGLCTVHANSARDALSRLETMVLMAGAELPSRAIREQMTAAIDFVVHVKRCEDGVRRVTSISEITGMESGTPLLQDVYVADLKRDSGRRKLEANYRATGVVPRFMDELRTSGMNVPSFGIMTGDAFE